MRLRRSLFLGLLAIPAALFGACSRDEQPPEAATASGMELRLETTPNTSVREIVVTIRKIDVRVADAGWMTLVSRPQTVDLLKLGEGEFDSLGVADISPGLVTELRVYVDTSGSSYVTTNNGVQAPLTMPPWSGDGIRIGGGFELPSCALGHLTIGLDGKRSIMRNPLSTTESFIFTPTARVKSLVVKSSCDGDSGPPPPPPPPPTTEDTGHDCDTGHDDPPIPPPVNEDSGAPTDDGGTLDPCAHVTCPGDDICINGDCRRPIK